MTGSSVDRWHFISKDIHIWDFKIKNRNITNFLVLIVHNIPLLQWSKRFSSLYMINTTSVLLRNRLGKANLWIQISGTPLWKKYLVSQPVTKELGKYIHVYPNKVYFYVSSPFSWVHMCVCVWEREREGGREREREERERIAHNYSINQRITLKSWTRLFKFQFALIPIGKTFIYLFFPQIVG